MGALTENHRCPRGGFRRITDALSTVAMGSIIGGAMTFLVADRPAGALVLAAAALGGVLANAVRQALGPKI